jgi:hypothetical protein
MSVNKGKKSLVNSTPNFSNQAVENSINELKIGWVIKGIEVDNAITNNSVLTASQKNDVKDTINNIAHVNVGRYLGDITRHTASIIDGSILPVDGSVTNPTQGTFLEILGLVQSLQIMIPDFYGTPASDKSRGVSDHFGILMNKFTETEDSSRPVFTTLKENLTFISNANLPTESALETAYDNMKSFLTTIRDDSTDFQQSLDNRASAIATAHTNFDTALQTHPYDIKRTQLINDREEIVIQLNLENSNMTSLRSYVTTLSDTQAYLGLAADETMRKLILNITQDDNWKAYYRDYATNLSNLNPIFTTNSDSDKESVINQVLLARGLPDVVDYLNIRLVADKAKKDDRIDTKGFDQLTTEQVITKCCQQLGISTAGNVYDQSQSLLSNLNQRDRDLIAQEVDLNESSDTLS